MNPSPSLLFSILHDVHLGFMDACQWPKAFIFLYSSKKIQRATLKCLLFNGVALLGSFCFFRWMMVPFFTHLYVYSNGWVDAENRCMQLWLAMVSLMYHSLWVYPIYLLSFTLNSVWYQDIAERVHTLHPTKGSSSALGSKPYASTSRKLNLAYTLADELYRYLFCFIYLVYATWIYWVPYVGPGGSFVLTCGLYAYSSFDYSWRNTRRPLHACIDVVHRHWAYFLGFGTPLTLATFFFPTVPGSALFAVLFPWYIVLAHLAHPPSTSTYPSIPMVQPILYLCDIVVRAVPYFWKKLRRT